MNQEIKLHFIIRRVGIEVHTLRVNTGLTDFTELHVCNFIYRCLFQHFPRRFTNRRALLKPSKTIQVPKLGSAPTKHVKMRHCSGGKSGCGFREAPLGFKRLQFLTALNSLTAAFRR